MLIDNVFIEYNNKNLSLREWADVLDISSDKLLNRYKKGFAPEDILSKERLVKHKKMIKVEYEGEEYSFSELEDITGILKELLGERYRKGFRGDKLFSKGKLTNNPNNILVEIKGESRTFKEWADISGIKIHTIRERYRKGIRGEAHIIPPLKKKTYNVDNSKALFIVLNGKKISLLECSTIFDIKYSTLLARYHKGYSPEDIVKVKNHPSSYSRELSPDDIEKYMSLAKEYSEGESLNSLANKYGLSDRTIKRNFLKLNIPLRDSKDTLSIILEKSVSTKLQNSLNKKISFLKEEGYEFVNPENYKGETHSKKDKEVRTRIKYKLKHLKCGKAFEGNVLTPSCTNCYSQLRSKGEELIFDYLEDIYKTPEIATRIIQNKEKNHRLEYDFYYPDKKIAIEYNGILWHSMPIDDSEEIKCRRAKSKDYHEYKTEQSLKRDIKLFHIWEGLPKDKYKRILKHILKKESTYSLKNKTLKLHDIKREPANIFLEKYSLYSFKSKALKRQRLHYLCLKDKNKTLAVLSYVINNKTNTLNIIDIASIDVKNKQEIIKDFIKQAAPHFKDTHTKVKKINFKESRDLAPSIEYSLFNKVESATYKKGKPLSQKVGRNGFVKSSKTKVHSIAYNSGCWLIDIQIK